MALRGYANVERDGEDGTKAQEGPKGRQLLMDG